MYEDAYSEGPGWEQQQAMEEKMRLELDCLVACYKGGNEKSAEILAASLGLTEQFQQEIDAHARTARVG